jgi:hypothetical protein
MYLLLFILNGEGEGIFVVYSRFFLFYFLIIFKIDLLTNMSSFIGERFKFTICFLNFIFSFSSINSLSSYSAALSTIDT